MTNSFTVPLAGNNARLEPDAFIAGKDISDLQSQLGKIGRLQNYIHAYHGTGAIITQHFEDGIFYYSSATLREVCRWRIPVISANHKTIKITLKGTGTNGNAIFTLSNNSSAGSKSFTFNSSKYDQGSIALASVSAEYSYLILEVQHTIQIDYLCIEYLPLSSPLAESRVNAVYMNGFFYPCGDDSFDADQPLSSALGQQLINNIRVLQKRPRMLFCASGLDLPESTTSPTFGLVRPQKGLTVNDLFALNTNFISWYNRNRLGFTYKLVMYVQNATAHDFSFSVYNRQITITAGTTAQWLEYDIATIFNADGVDGDLSMPLIQFSPRMTYFLTNATPILSISFWGA